MKKRFEELTILLSEELQLKTLKFLENNLKDEEDIPDVINLVLSSHLSSLFNMMDGVTANHNKHNNLVAKFINSLTSYISTLEQIENIKLETLQ